MTHTFTDLLLYEKYYLVVHGTLLAIIFSSFPLNIFYFKDYISSSYKEGGSVYNRFKDN